MTAEKLKTIEERCMLQSSLGYANYLSEEIDQGKIKTVKEIREKISDDAERARAVSASMETRFWRV